MGPMNYNIYSDAPTMILPPPQDSPFTPVDSSQIFVPSNASAAFFNEPSSFADVSSATTNGSTHRSSWTSTTATTPIFTSPSRKRSRDESALVDDEDTPETSYFPLTPAPPSIPEEEPIYGEGMTLLNPKTGIIISAESQTGTWYEETTEAAAVAATKPITPLHRPEMQSRKSQRLDLTAPGLDDIAASAVQAESPPKSAPVDPTIDESTQALGIGWTRISESDVHLQAAARGWAKYIENHYPEDVHGAKILLKSKGLNAYLVGAEEGFFLFKEDLSEGRLVARIWERTLANLMAGGANVIFDGETITAKGASVSSPHAPVDESTMVETGETVMTNGQVDHEPEKVMAVDVMTNGQAHEATEETKAATEPALNLGHVDGSMDLD
jgi:hypothetical protein